MTFEASYDDGRTWRTVDITRDGDHATATLHHPARAKFVSVRFTAADEAGSTVQHSTIRSYGFGNNNSASEDPPLVPRCRYW